MNYENWISYRYLTASKGRFLAFLNFVSVAGVAIGVAALIVVTGVMTGFDNNLRDKIIGTTPHLVVEKETGVTHFDSLISRIDTIKGVVAASPYVQGNIFLQDGSQTMGVALRGIRPSTEKKITKIREYLKRGNINNLNDNGIIIGSQLAKYFGYTLGDRITLIAPGSGISGKGWRYQFKVVGIFTTGMIDYDTNLVIVDLKKAQEIFALPAGTVSGIGVRLKHPSDAEQIKKEVYNALGYSFLVRTWIDVNRNLFDALFLEKWGLFIILTLMVLVASFNIISTLVVTVTSKIHDIGILQSFGVPKRSIRRIFTRQGVLIGIKGTLWGLVIGVAVSYFLRTYVHVPRQIYSVDHVPVDLQLSDMMIIMAAALVISFLASIYPAIRAARLEPVEALRYE